MPELYHGTRQDFAVAMAGSGWRGGTIDVTRGEGEFGRGFYAQDSVASALRWALLRFGVNRGAVLVLNIDDAAYNALRVRRLTLTAARRLVARVRRHDQGRRFVTAHDVLVGPIVSAPNVLQHKFQTPAAQAMLHGGRTQRTVRR